MPIISNSTIGSGQVVDPTAKGDLVTFSNAVVNLGIAPSVNGKVLTQKTDEATGLIWKLPVASKGGLLTSDGTNPDEIPVGSDKKVLTAKSSASNGFGIEWDTPKADLFLTTKGDLLTSTGTNINKKGLGTDGQVLLARPASTFGIEYNFPPISTVFNCGLLSIFDANQVLSLTQEVPITFYNNTLVAFGASLANVRFRIPRKGFLTNISMDITSLNLENSGEIKLTLQRSVSSDVDVFENINSTGISISTDPDISVATGEFVNWKITKTTGAINTADLVKVSFLQLTYVQTSFT